ncbi:MAG: carbon-nitrogen hydrolase family protein [Acidobacteriota bacterium]
MTVDTFRIALIQQRATTDLDDNLARAERALDRAAEEGCRLAAFAELGLTPFYPQSPADEAAPESAGRDLAETIPGPTTERMALKASEHGMVVIPNLYEREGDRRFDTSVVLSDRGEILSRTRMLHIPDFDCFHERTYYDPGDLGLPIVDVGGFRVGIAICYDRHYPEVMRALAGADLVLVPQAGATNEWPPGVFEAELQTAALQNGYFAALINRVGSEERLDFAGESFVCAPNGEVIARAPQGEDHLLLCDLDPSRLESSPARLLFLEDRRRDLNFGSRT